MDITKETQKDPILIFQEWLNLATDSEINDPGAMALATADKNGKPSVRMVLLKQADQSGFKFHTNRDSKKGQQLAENQNAALCFHWKSLRKQVRIEGLIEVINKEEADEYFKTRPYERQIGAWASQQSRPLDSRKYLEDRIQEVAKKHPRGTKVPRPDYWIGYRLKPIEIEFWWDNPDRLHDRLLYTKNERDSWDITRLYP